MQDSGLMTFIALSFLINGFLINEGCGATFLYAFVHGLVAVNTFVIKSSFHDIDNCCTVYIRSKNPIAATRS